MLKKLGLVVIAICSSPLLVLMLAFMAIYAPFYGLIKLLASSRENAMQSSDSGSNKPNQSRWLTLRVKHA